MMTTAAAAVYLLCALTSTMCALLLILKYRANRVRLLLWTSTCFVGLAINNILLFFDLAVFTSTIDLSVIRTVPALVGLLALLWGFVWDTA